MLLQEFTWLNEPPEWRLEAEVVSIITGKDTDFWQKTFYGFRHDDGHALLRPVEGDFTASATVIGQYRHLYDQAGLMFRVDASTWIKAGIEYTDGLMHFSVVVTREVSDWSVIPLPLATPSDPVHVRLTRHDDAVRVQYAIGEAPWQMARVSPFPAGPAAVGVMACSPQRSGFEATFRDIRVGSPIARQLHAS